MDATSHEFIGTGWKFPVEFKLNAATPVMVSGEESIQNSLRILFSTMAGERIMHPDYGSDLDHFVFEGASRSMLTYMEAMVSDAILFNEPRIVVDDIKIEPRQEDPSYLVISINYTISATNNRYNFVYPFYIKEATNLQR